MLSRILLVIIVTFTAGMLEASELVVSSYATSLAEQTEAVKQNIQIAARKLNGIVIPAGSVFSFSTEVGEANTANGYRVGNVLYRDKVVSEPGGGLCQVSSTLYNSFLLAGFDIIERHRHFQPVTYVPLGLDATIKYGKKDLRMKNSTGGAITIRTETTDTLLVIKLTAERMPKSRCRIVAEEVEIPIPLNEDVAEGDIRPAIEVEVYRIRSASGGREERALLYKDFYPPVRFK